MYPILFELGPVKIYTYGLLVASAFLVSTYLVKREARREGISQDIILNLCLGLVIFGILGARLLYILQNLKFYLAYPGQILMLHKGGLSFFGGLILAIIFAVIFLKRARLSVLHTFDLVSPYLALAQAIGRIGCFFNGCCYGRLGHPVQLYAAFNLLLIFIILRVFQAKQRAFAGKIFLLYCLLYSISRFFMEFLRGDNLPVMAGLTIHQLISIGIILISGAIWWRNAKSSS